jgi:hypothetical protein
VTIGMSLPAFTLLHVIVSLIAMISGAVVIAGIARARIPPTPTLVFLATTAATSITGFLFHSKFGPPHVVGMVSIATLALALYALLVRRHQGPWRWVYVVSSVIVLYLNVFVGVVQIFQKLSVLKPYSSGPLFGLTQTAVALCFVLVGIIAVKRFHPVTGELKPVEGAT